MIGSGIFTVIGTAISGQKFDTSSIYNAPLLDFIIHHSATTGRPGAGPALALSLVLVAIVCAFTALCYAELASMIPIAGSAYTYTYATMGELIAWIIGWDLILEYAVSNMAVSVGFAQHLVNLLDWFGVHPALKWISPAYLPSGLSDLQGNQLFEPGWHFGFNWPAFLIVMILTVVLVRGIRESAETNNIMVLLKIAAILAFIFAGAAYIHPANWQPFIPNGWAGVLTGGSIIFFTYIGFDSVSTAAEEAKNPQRDLPIGIIATLVICTVLYIAVAVVLTGMVPWQSLLDDAAPVVNALKRISDTTGAHSLHWIRLVVLFGAMMGMISSLLVFQLGQARVWFAMSRDGLLPAAFSRVHPRFRTPDVATWVAGFVVGVKIAAILIFITAALGYLHPGNWHPYAPHGWSGILTGGSIIFFTYIGLDSVSTAAEECKRPQRDLPIGIVATLIVCTILYLGVAICLTGLVPWQSMVDDAAPVVNALKKLSLLPGAHALHWVRLIVLVGAMMGMISSLLVYQLGQSRVWFSMSRDGLLPKIFSRVHPRFRTPAFSTWVAGFLVAIPSGLFDVELLANLSNIGTLFAFMLVSIGVMVLRFREPDRRRGFRVPGGPIVPILSVICCFLLMSGLPIITWLRFFIWLAVGLVIYYFYSRHRSEFAKAR